MGGAIAVVIPVFRQPHFMRGAIASAWEQSIRDDIRVVIINDGCPDERTRVFGTEAVTLAPTPTVYIEQPNRGLGAARNAAIRRAFAEWPEVDYVFPLDADNLLSTWTLALLRERLQSHPKDVGWAYSDLLRFGDATGLKVMGPRFTRYRLLHENLCDAGSLIRRAIFEGGCWFSEPLPAYEDWEFFVHAVGLGYSGVRVPGSGFRYRVRRDSMSAAAWPHRHELIEQIRRAHPRLYSRAYQERAAETEMPLFVLFDGDGPAITFNDPSQARPRLGGFEEVVRAIERTSSWASDNEYVPPIAILATPALRRRLTTGPGATALLRRAHRLLREPLTSAEFIAERSTAGRPVGIALRSEQLATFHRLWTQPLFVDMPPEGELDFQRLCGAWKATIEGVGETVDPCERRPRRHDGTAPDTEFARVMAWR